MFSPLVCPQSTSMAGTPTSRRSARAAVAAGVLATRSLRSGSVPFDVPELDAELADYFHCGQHNSHSPTESS